MRITNIFRLVTLALTLCAWCAVANAQPKPSDAPAAKPEKADAKPEKADAKPAESEAEQVFTKGRDALFQGKYNDAIELLSKAVALDRSKTSYRLNLARAYRYAGKDDQAAIHLEEIVKAAPDHVEAGQTLGELYSSAKRWKDVVRILDPLLRYRHDYPTYHMLAEAQNNLGQPEKARKSYEEAIKLNPQSASDHYQLGNIYLAGNFFALAAESYRSALRLGLDSPVLHYKLGSAYFNLRNYFGNVSVQTVKSGAAGTINGPWYLIEPVPGQKDVFRCAPETSAIYQVAKALADGIEDRPDIHVLQATIYLNARRYAQAYEMFTKIGPKVPKEDKALFFYYDAQAAFGTGHYDRYLELLEEAIKLDPAAYKATRVDAYLAVADQYNQAGNLDKYIEFLAKAVDESPQTASLHLKLGYAYEEAQKYQPAIAQWRMVLDIEPDHPERIKLLNLIDKYRSGAAMTVAPGPPPNRAEPAPKAAPKPRPASGKTTGQ
jgi:tetratricopeptide (TPR) repeat protein